LCYRIHLPTYDSLIQISHRVTLTASGDHSTSNDCHCCPPQYYYAPQDQFLSDSMDSALKTVLKLPCPCPPYIAPKHHFQLSMKSIQAEKISSLHPRNQLIQAYHRIDKKHHLPRHIKPM